jgi:hypothetical protein
MHDAGGGFVLPGREVTPHDAGSQESRFDLTLQVQETADVGLRGHLVYETALYDRETVELLAGHRELSAQRAQFTES